MALRDGGRHGEALLMAAASNPDLTGLLAGARSLYVSACAAEIPGLPGILRASGVRDAIVTGVFSPLVNHRSYADADLGLSVRAFLLTRALKDDAARGLVHFCPWRYSAIDRWITGPGRFDAALVMLSPPDADGTCSVGVQADFFPSFQGQVPRVIAFINPNMPDTAGHRRIRYDALAAVVDCDIPLLEMEGRAANGASVTIARSIADIVPNGATVQLGTGQLPSEVLAQLASHRHLRVHTGIVDDNILRLEEAGALSRDAPIVTGTAIGTRRLYDALSDRRRFALRPVAFTHDYTRIGLTERFMAINSVLQVDLYGQVSGEAIGGRIAATPGGLPDFARAAQASAGGRSIIAVRAEGEGGRHPGIVPLIDDPAIITNGGVDADVVVTEFGIADVRGLSMDARAQAIIAIAAPAARDALEEAWRRMRQRFFGRRAAAAPPASGTVAGGASRV